MTTKGVPIDSKRSPQCYPQEESPFSLKEESHWPPWDSVLKRSPMAGKHGQTAETRKCCDGEILDNIVYQRGNALRLDTDEWSRVVTDSVIH